MEKVFYGPNNMNSNLAGRRISEVLTLVKDGFGLQDLNGIQAFINGNVVSADYVVQNEDRIELRAAMGTKG